ncbi:hypothetical protein [Jonesia quinghaiensis]|uniref:hypothetical protein n=1 Tax=Jonesia quinghaiensis TaxID=262806 RepID=UPI0004919FF4|nr:hypothetical protein [Jonesia quinghaiensis]
MTEQSHELPPHVVQGEAIPPAHSVALGRYRARYALARAHSVLGEADVQLISQARRRYVPWFALSSLAWGALALWAIVLPMLKTDALSAHYFVMGAIMLAMNIPRWVAIAWSQAEYGVTGHNAVIAGSSAALVTREDVLRQPLALIVAFFARAVPAALVAGLALVNFFDVTSSVHQESSIFVGPGLIIYAALFGAIAVLVVSLMFVLSLLEAPVLWLVTALVGRGLTRAEVGNKSSTRTSSWGEKFGMMLECSMPVIAARFSLFGHVKAHPMVMFAMADLQHGDSNDPQAAQQ